MNLSVVWTVLWFLSLPRPDYKVILFLFLSIILTKRPCLMLMFCDIGRAISASQPAQKTLSQETQ